MKRLPDAELELMMIIWDSEQPVTRTDIESCMSREKQVVPSTILTLLARLEKRGFIRHEKQGKINYYYSVADKNEYLAEEGKSVLSRMFGSSITNFVTTLYEGRRLDDEEVKRLQEFIDSQTGEGQDE